MQTTLRRMVDQAHSVMSNDPSAWALLSTEDAITVALITNNPIHIMQMGMSMAEAIVLVNADTLQMLLSAERILCDELAARRAIKP